MPTPDSTYYPIPYYAALFNGKWYNVKTLIGLAKEAKLKNSAPIKYHIEISNKYCFALFGCARQRHKPCKHGLCLCSHLHENWESIFKSEGITDRRKQQQRVVREKQNILDFLTGVENSGKACRRRRVCAFSEKISRRTRRTRRRLSP